MKRLIASAVALVKKPRWRGPLVEQARDTSVFGPKRVVSLAEAARAWEDTLCPVEPVALRYEMATLVNCANQNRAREAWWHLVWCFGFSLRKQRERIAEWHLPENCRYFDASSWWLTRAENKWADLDYQGGYYLIDFFKRFGGMPWRAQESEIRKLGDEARRSPDAMVTEATITLHRAKHVQMLHDWYHLGYSLDSQGRRIHVGNLDLERGLCIGGGDPHKPGPNLYAVVYWPWDF